MYLELEGEMTEPVANVTQFSLLVFISANPKPGQGEISSIGSITKFKPVIQMGVGLSLEEFQTLVQLAAAERLQSCYLAFQAPHRGHALIVSISFSSVLPDSDEV